jgi:hypothetical protein
MTTPEIYKLANETTEKQYDNLVNLFSTKEEKSLNILIQLGDSKKLALWTVIAERYNNPVSERYEEFNN